MKYEEALKLITELRPKTFAIWNRTSLGGVSEFVTLVHDDENSARETCFADESLTSETISYLYNVLDDSQQKNVVVFIAEMMLKDAQEYQQLLNDTEGTFAG